MRKLLILMGACIFLLTVAGNADGEVAAANQVQAMQVNKVYKGSLANKKGTSYKVTLPEAGNVTLSIKRNAKTSFAGQIQNSQGYSYTFVYTKRQDDTSGFDEVQVGLPKGTYYVSIHNNGGQVSKADYQFKTTYIKSDYYEKESNDTVKTANAIKLNASYKGVISHSDDRDLFAFDVPQDGNVTLAMKQKRDTIWRGHIEDRMGKEFGEVYSNENGNLTTYLKKGTYYFVMENYNGSVDVPYEFSISDRNAPLKASQIHVTNSTGQADLVQVSNLKKGDIIAVYNAKSKGKVLARTTAQGSSVDLDVEELGKKAGKVYVTVTRSPLRESDRIAQTFTGEASPSLKTSQVKIANHKGKSDIVEFHSLEKGDVVKVYEAERKGNLLMKGTAKGKQVTLSIKQLGKKAGKVYVTITKSGQLESDRVAISYQKEK